MQLLTCRTDLAEAYQVSNPVGKMSHAVLEGDARVQISFLLFEDSTKSARLENFCLEHEIWWYIDDNMAGAC